MTALPLLDAPLPPWLAATRQPWHAHQYAMFSSMLGGIVTDPLWMNAPVDDHLVHRGDGVFETLKCTAGRIYLCREHIARLFRSAARIELVSPWTEADIIDIVRQVVRAGGRNDCLIRVLLSRGPGGFGVNPYECPRPGLYVIAHRLTPPFMDAHPNGARVKSSAIPVKAGVFATVKTCNYLPNALMKKEAIDAGVDFTVSFDEQGFLGEGATENIGLLTAARELLVPETGRILAGTTMLRTMELARPLVERGELTRIAHARLTREDLAKAAELFILGTTPDVTAIVEFDGQPVSGGRPGPVWKTLSDLLCHDIAHGDHHVAV